MMGLANAILTAVSTEFASPAPARRDISARKIVAATGLFPGLLGDKVGKSLTVKPAGAGHGDSHDATGNSRDAIQRPCRAACDPAQPAFRPDIGPGARSGPGQSRHPAAKSGAGFHAILPEQSETVPSDRRFGAGRPAHPGFGRGSRYPHRPAALSGL